MVRILWVGTTRNGFSMASLADAMCSSSGQVTSAVVGEGLTPTFNLPRSRLRRVSLSSWVPAAAASASAARVLLLVLPVPQYKLMVVRCVVCVRCVSGMCLWDGIEEAGWVGFYVVIPTS